LLVVTITVTCYSWHHLAVTIYLHVAPCSGRHSYYAEDRRFDSFFGWLKDPSIVAAINFSHRAGGCNPLLKVVLRLWNGEEIWRVATWLRHI